MTQTPVSHYITCQGREVHVTEWGKGNAEKMVMWHGLARTGRDFDPLAQVLAERYHIIAPDTIGRGLSQWAVQPDTQYCLDFYGKIASDLCAHFGFQTYKWIGTSMGAALGIRLAATTMRDNMTHLVLNDMGPKIEPSAIERILTYAGNPPVYQSVSELEKGLRTIYKPYGYLTDDQWRLMAETSVRRNPDGTVTMHYDPKMVRQFIAHPNDYDQWDYFNSIECKMLLIRGAETDLLSAETRDTMLENNKNCELYEVEGVGHAPAMNVAEQIERIQSFLDS
ncbi:MAG: alpha/beta fold hydrolase [Terasakiella sp.]|uniref:alpha/beta fold hydrolase n=1 Tax=unclassified Terasakiella TaxID=2614952 RepID=UPI003AFFF215